MKQMTMLLAVATVVAALGAPAAYGQRGPHGGGRGWGSGSSYNRMYDPKSVQTVSGKVVSVEHFTPGRGMSSGVHLTLKTEKETLPVHLGPSWYIENQDLQIEPGDKIEVKGSRIAFEGKPAIVAAEVRRGDDLLKLRDDAGVPFWAGWRRR
jgi:hypothetical protein